MANPFARAQSVVSQLIAAETESGIAADKQRILSAERHDLEAVMQIESAPKKPTMVENWNVRHGVTGYSPVKTPPDMARLIKQTNEAVRVAKMWGVEIK